LCRDELFSPDYAYFSSYSSSWLAHSKQYVDDMIARFGLDASSMVVEVGANDGYLLQYVKLAGIPCLGVEPTKSTATAAREKDIEIVEDFFSVQLAETLAIEDKRADLMVANNVLAHVPDINDFVSGFQRLLKPEGIATFEFPHLMQLVTHNQFDTIYHEHFSYLSLTVVNTIFEKNGLIIFDVEELTTHGGSLRVFSCKNETTSHEVTDHVKNLLDIEENIGIKTREYYTAFQERINNAKDDFVAFLIDAKRNGKKVVGYGAAAKGNTLFNYAGIRSDLIPFVVDANPQKQGKFLPGNHIPIVDQSQIHALEPDYVVIIPWNLKEEITTELSYIREWDGKFVLAIPELLVF
jgi:ubiquinone/menaquinone biosynthesis C-methylase UbiE